MILFSPPDMDEKDLSLKSNAVVQIASWFSFSQTNRFSLGSSFEI